MAIPEKSCPEEVCESASNKGSYILIWFKSCWRKLTRNTAINNPSIPVQLTENTVELRDGSVNFPIRLPAIQKSNATAITALMIMTADGTIQSWDPSNQFGKKRLVLIDGAIVLVDDYSSDLFDASMCSGGCADIDGIIGYKEIPIVCPGEPDRIAIQLWKLPACCAGEIEDPEV